MIVFRGFRQYDLIDTKRRLMLANTKIILTYAFKEAQLKELQDELCLFFDSPASRSIH